MLTFYEEHFNNLIGDKGWSYSRHEFSSELAFLLKMDKRQTP